MAVRFLAGALLCTWPAMAKAAARLDWIAPPECPHQPEVLDAVGRLAPHADTNEVTARVTVTRSSDGRWQGRVVLVTDRRAAERSVDASTCAAIADAVAVMVALAIVPAPASQPAQERRTQPTTSPAASQTPAAERVSLAKLATHNGSHLGASLVFDAGVLPTAVAGLVLGVGWRSTHLELAVDGSVFLPDRANTADSTTEGASFWMASGSARACLVVPVSGATIGTACAGFGIDFLAASGFGTAERQQLQDWIVAPLGELNVEWWPSPGLGLRGGARALVPLARPTFAVERRTGAGSQFADIYRPAVVAVEPSLEVIVPFGK
jgi:hypothetical protein